MLMDIVNEFAGLVYYVATSNDYLDLLFELAFDEFFQSLSWIKKDP